MYGMALPILFPIAAFGIFNMYVNERLLLAYYYKQPPVYDDKLHKAALNIICGAPIFMFAFGFWVLGNRQIFFNHIEIKHHDNEIEDPGHGLFDFLKGINPTVFILVILVPLVLQRFTVLILKPILSRFGLVRDSGASMGLDVDEGLGTYFGSLAGHS